MWHKSSLRIISFVGTVVAGVLFVYGTDILPAHAQGFLSNTTGIQLELTPAYPTPESIVQVSINDYSLNTMGATIRWFVNEMEFSDSLNKRSITIPVGTLGEKKSVRVTLSRQGAPTLSATRVIVPNTIDIILEAQTYVPAFYTGRALPSGQSPIRAIALVHDASGGIQNAYTYKWTLGNTVLLGGSMKGAYVLEQEMPRYENTELSVEVFDTSGAPIGRRSIMLSPTEPELHFYEHTLLRGLSGRVAVDPHALVGEEVTFFGEPYYLNAENDLSGVSFSWIADRKRIESSPDVPNAVTLRKNATSGTASLSLTALTETRIPQYVTNTLELVY